jgi:calcium/calmodulin-dependent protein kinase I
LSRDIWAIGVITYFLLCGYTPFDRDTNIEEMQAILDADYSFTPEEYWAGVSDTARDFINRCLTVNPEKRMTAHAALTHPWVKEDASVPDKGEKDLLPNVKKNFNARTKLHAAIDTVLAINQLRAGQQRLIKNLKKANHPEDPATKAAQANAVPGPEEMEGVEGTGQLGSRDVDKMDIDTKVG